MIHASSVDKNLKLNFFYVPHCEKIRKFRNKIDENTLTNNDVDDDVSNFFMLTKTRPKKVEIEKACNEWPETDDTIENDERIIVKFNNKSTCLSSIIIFLDNATDAEIRVTKASDAMGVLRFIWDDVNAPLTIKVQSHNTIP